MVEEKLVVVAGLDYVAAPLLRRLSPGYSTGLCVLLEGGAEAVTECNKHGYTALTTSDSTIISNVVSGFAAGAPTTAVFVGSVPSELLTSCAAACTRSVRVGFDVIPDDEEAPFPEFAAINCGADKSRVRVSDVESGSLVAVGEVDISPLETAISLRYRHVQVIPDLVLRGLEKQRGGEFLQVEEEELTTATKSEPSKKRSGPWSAYIDPDLTLVDAARFIRACTFPPKHFPVLKSEVDGLEYYVDSAEQYAEYIASIGGSLTGEVPVIGGGGIVDTQVAPSGYAGDTHWYSNVGGTIVKMQAEKTKMRKKEDGGKDYIPGQAVSTSAKKKLRMNEPLIGLTAQGYISSALTSGWIGVEGPHIKKFEAAIARVCQVDAACAVQSGTAALYGAMKALGISDSSHHVIVPTYTCAACADAIVHAGGVPIAVDCEMDSYGLDFRAVKTCLEKDDSVVGIVIAPCYGVPSRDHMKIYGLCKEQGIWLCEDNCESYGATMQIDDSDDPKTAAAGNVGNVANVGSLSTMSVVSVRSEKMVGVGEGGAILSRDTALVSKARWWCSRSPVRGCGLWRVYEHENVGQNFRLPELLGAVGLAACENLPVMISQKRKIHSWYQEGLKEMPYIKFQQARPLDEPVWWLNSLKIELDKLPSDVAEKYRGKLAKNRNFNLAETVGMEIMKNHPNIEIRPAFYPLHKMSSFSETAQPCPTSELVYQTLLCVPSSAQLQEEDVKEVCAAFKASMTEVLAGL